MINVQKIKNDLLSINKVEEVEAMPRGKRNNGPVRFGIKEVALDRSSIKTIIDFDFVVLHNIEGYSTVIDVYEKFGHLENYQGDVLDVVVEEGNHLVCEVSEGSHYIKGDLVRIDKDDIDENNYKAINI